MSLATANATEAERKTSMLAFTTVVRRCARRVIDLESRRHRDCNYATYCDLRVCAAHAVRSWYAAHPFPLPAPKRPRPGSYAAVKNLPRTLWTLVLAGLDVASHACATSVCFTLHTLSERHERHTPDPVGCERRHAIAPLRLWDVADGFWYAMSLRPTHLHVSVSLSSDQWALVAGSCVRHLVCSAPPDVLHVGGNLETLCLVGPALVRILHQGSELGTLTSNDTSPRNGAFMSRVTYRGRKSIALDDARYMCLVAGQSSSAPPPPTLVLDTDCTFASRDEFQEWYDIHARTGAKLEWTEASTVVVVGDTKKDGVDGVDGNREPAIVRPSWDDRCVTTPMRTTDSVRITVPPAPAKRATDPLWWGASSWGLYS